MYKKIRDAFFSEFLKDGLSDLPENFYRDSRNYLETITDEKIKFERTKYYLKELLNLRYYKVNCLKESPNKFTEDEKKLSKFIEETFFKNVNIDDMLETEDLSKKKSKIQANLDIGQENEDCCQKPKHINSENDIDIVRVITKFPCFTDGNLQYILNKNDIISLDRKFSKILEKHNVVKRVNIHEDEKKDKKVLSIL